MTICIATPDYLPDEGGITAFSLHLSELLVRTGHKAIILTRGHENEKEDDISSNQVVTIIRLNKTYHELLKRYTPYFRPGGLDAASWIALGYAMQHWLLKNHAQYAIDIIEVSDYGGTGIFLCHKELPPVVITGHGSLLQYSRYIVAKRSESAEIIKKMELLSYQYASNIITHSPLNKQDIKKIPGTTVSLSLMPFVPPATVDKKERTADALVVAGMYPYKGPFILAAALRKLKDGLPGIKVKWIGGDTHMNNENGSVAETIRKEYSDTWMSNFVWLKAKEHRETLAEMNNAAILIIPSVWETFNYTVLEGAALRKPMIITDGAGAVYLFLHEKNALIVPADDSKALADAIVRLTADTALQQKLGENAHELVSAVFNPEKIISERIAIYQQAITNKQQRKDSTGTLQFLENYCTPYRKLYFKARAGLKKLVKRS